ncbi:hypothetical protein B0H16DRAFT_1745192 [Mycena metata]|uniref:Uncharacterized protein n=1 Tax=Mycena metata TaxID=1033252 RepID=A0AAD7H424_9AGAR|nr:hypothetical protein B0H16DRAFT_1745192 [Mycena metata]
MCGGLLTTAMTGTDNVPGATRFGPVDKHNSKFTYALPGFHHSPAHIDAYAETMRFESICAGRATYIDLLTYICSNDTATAYKVWYTAHMFVFPALAADLGATVLAGDCRGAKFERSSLN